MVAGGPSDRAATDRVHAFHLAMGLPAVRLGARACRRGRAAAVPRRERRRRPARRPPGRQPLGGLALEDACRAAGVDLVADRVVRVEVADGRVLGVVLDDGGPRSSDVVVVAAGSRSGALAGLPEAWRPPVRPVRGVTLRLAAPDGVPRLRRTVRALVHGRSCYLVPRDDGGLVLGATVEERGFALDVPLGGLADLVEDARRVVPALDEYSVAEVAPGLRPGSPDNGPIVGPTAGRRAPDGHRALPQRHPPGTGHGGRGGPAAGRPGRRGRRPDRDRSTRFRPDRFAEAGGGAVSPATVNGAPGRSRARHHRGRPGGGPVRLAQGRRRGRRTARSCRAAPGGPPRSAAGDDVEIVTAAAGG